MFGGIQALSGFMLWGTRYLMQYQDKPKHDENKLKEEEINIGLSISNMVTQ